jgi:hypothetical protein
MGLEAKKYATYEDLEKLPMIASPNPGPRHTHVASSFGGDIVNPFEAIELDLGSLWCLVLYKLRYF